MKTKILVPLSAFILSFGCFMLMGCLDTSDIKLDLQQMQEPNVRFYKTSELDSLKEDLTEFLMPGERETDNISQGTIYIRYVKESDLIRVELLEEANEVDKNRQ
jgi:hypothetical protein